MRRLLVTGGAGFIGSEFVRHWMSEHPGDRVVVLDALTYAGNCANLEPVNGRAELRFVQGNICDQPLVEQLLRDERLDTIVHFAAESHVDRSILHPAAFIETNVIGTYALLEAARKVWVDEKLATVHRFHHVSTDEVYGSLGPNDSPFDERSSYKPNSPYSASKAASDHLVRAYHRTYGLQTTVSNCSNNYGPFHFPEKLIPLTIINILKGRAIPIYGDGRNIRDWIYVGDHCCGVELVVSRGTAGEVYNIGARAETENLTLVHMLCDLADDAFRADSALRSKYPDCPAARGARTSSLIRFVADRPGHDRRYAIDCGKIARELGFEAPTVLEQGLRKTFGWYCQNETWWHGISEHTGGNSTCPPRTERPRAVVPSA